MVYLSDEEECMLRAKFYRKLERKLIKTIYKIPGPGCGGVRASLTRRKIANREMLEYEIANPLSGTYQIKIRQNGWLPDYLSFRRWEVHDMIGEMFQEHLARIRERLAAIGLGDCTPAAGFAKTPYSTWGTIHPSRLVLTVSPPNM